MLDIAVSFLIHILQQRYEKERTHRSFLLLHCNRERTCARIPAGTFDRRKENIGTDIKVVQWRWPTGEPLVKKLNASIYEIRSNLKNRIARILFSQVSDKLVLLHSFIKKTQKTDEKDIKLAIKRLKEVLNEK